MYGTAGGEADLIGVWAAELGAFDASDIRLALEAMRFAYKDFPPSLFQFADLCADAKRRRVQGSAKLGYDRKSGPIDAHVLAEINRLTRGWKEGKRDPRDWARRILKREQEGERMPMYALQCAREALGL